MDVIDVDIRSFSYKGEDLAALKNVRFSVERGRARRTHRQLRVREDHSPARHERFDSRSVRRRARWENRASREKPGRVLLRRARPHDRQRVPESDRSVLHPQGGRRGGPRRRESGHASRGADRKGRVGFREHENRASGGQGPHRPLGRREAARRHSLDARLRHPGDFLRRAVRQPRPRRDRGLSPNPRRFEGPRQDRRHRRAQALLSGGSLRQAPRHGGRPNRRFVRSGSASRGGLRALWTSRARSTRPEPGKPPSARGGGRFNERRFGLRRRASPDRALDASLCERARLWASLGQTESERARSPGRCAALRAVDRPSRGEFGLGRGFADRTT